jgi:hypothetical protein
MFWNEVEDAEGAYALRHGARFTRALWWDQLPQVAPLLILGYGHPRHDGGGQPASPEAVAAFANHARWLVGQTRERVRMVEVWNEWNLKAGAVAKLGAQGGAAQYVRLAAAARKAVHAVDPGVRVLVGGVGEDHPDWHWMREAVSLGLIDAADGVSLHLYNHCDRANVGADEMMRRLDRLQAILSQRAGRDVALYLTEVGWPVHRGACEVGEADAAIFTLRLLLEASARSWLKGVWIYEVIDGGDDPTNREQRFGLLRRDGSERPAGCAVREFGAAIAARPAQLLRRGNVSVALYEDAGRSTVFVWNRERARAVRVRVRTSTAALPLPAAPVPCQGREGSAVVVANQLELHAELDGTAPSVFVVPRPITIEEVQLD